MDDFKDEESDELVLGRGGKVRMSNRHIKEKFGEWQGSKK